MNTGLHFAAPLWFLGLLVVPLLGWRWHRSGGQVSGRWRRYADAHLLPFLSREAATVEPPPAWRSGGFLYWALLWLLLLTALAGPRWEQRELQLAAPGDSLLILLDLSRSMNATDVAPSRLARARQEIEDLIERNLHAGGTSLRLGLIAFATRPYGIAPISADSLGLRHRLPALTTDLTRDSGSRLLAALERATQWLNALPDEGARCLLLISDGDFDEPELTTEVAALTAQGLRLSVLGLGTPEGALVPAAAGAQPLLDAQGAPVHSRLNEPLLRTLAEAGAGVYRRADYRMQDTDAILKATLDGRRMTRAAGDRARVWREAFHWPLLLLALLLAPQVLREARP